MQFCSVPFANVLRSDTSIYPAFEVIICKTLEQPNGRTEHLNQPNGKTEHLNLQGNLLIRSHGFSFASVVADYGELWV